LSRLNSTFSKIIFIFDKEGRFLMTIPYFLIIIVINHFWYGRPIFWQGTPKPSFYKSLRNCPNRCQRVSLPEFRCQRAQWSMNLDPQNCLLICHFSSSMITWCNSIIVLTLGSVESMRTIFSGSTAWTQVFQPIWVQPDQLMFFAKFQSRLVKSSRCIVGWTQLFSKKGFGWRKKVFLGKFRTNSGVYSEEKGMKFLSSSFCVPRSYCRSNCIWSVVRTYLKKMLSWICIWTWLTNKT